MASAEGVLRGRPIVASTRGGVGRARRLAGTRPRLGVRGRSVWEARARRRCKRRRGRQIEPDGRHLEADQLLETSARELREEATRARDPLRRGWRTSRAGGRRSGRRAAIARIGCQRDPTFRLATISIVRTAVGSSCRTSSSVDIIYLRPCLRSYMWRRCAARPAWWGAGLGDACRSTCGKTAFWQRSSGWSREPNGLGAMGDRRAAAAASAVSLSRKSAGPSSMM